MSWVSTALVITAVGTGYGAYTSYKTGKIQEAQLKEDARQVKLDRIAQEEEERELRRRARQAGKRELGAIEARIAGMGLAMEGSPLVAFSLNAARQELEFQESKRQSDIFGTQAQRREKGLIYQGHLARLSGKIGATSTLLSGASRMATMKAST